MLLIMIRLLYILSKRYLILVILALAMVGFVITAFKCYRALCLQIQTTRIVTKSLRSVNMRNHMCHPELNFVFLKTHKTGSSTMTNIFNRFAEIHNRTMALPLDNLHHFLWPLPFQPEFSDKTVRQPTVLANHARFNARSFVELMPAKTKYVTILRHPSTQFPSLFKFMDFGSGINFKKDKKYSMEFFLDNAFEILKSLQKYNSQILIENPSLYLLRNPQLFDLGFDQSLSENDHEIQKMILTVSEKFHIVLIMEYFDESLVLLKRMMCWSLNDIVYFKLNRQTGNGDFESQRLKIQILKWAKADVMLYDYFNKSLWKKIRREGPDFWKEVAMLRVKNNELKKTCLQEGVFLEKPYPGSSALTYGYKLKENIAVYFESLCKRLIRSETEYIDYFRKTRIKSL